jgi:bifunctional ADP-heptose synthase (sugar kinase/adenylyltransferase)
LDIVGAGDSAIAGIACGLGAGATFTEAALLGNLAAAVTVKKIGTTGTAAPAEVLEKFRLWSAQNKQAKG